MDAVVVFFGVHTYTHTHTHVLVYDVGYSNASKIGHWGLATDLLPGHPVFFFPKNKAIKCGSPSLLI